MIIDTAENPGELTADSLQLTASVGYGIRNTPEPLAVSRKPIADSVETMMTADSLQLAAYGLRLTAYRMSRLTRSPARLDLQAAEWRVEKGVSTTVRK